jgi:hypothetical protein
MMIIMAMMVMMMIHADAAADVNSIDEDYV